VELIAAPAIHKRIVLIRERQVMLDADLAELYGVATGFPARSAITMRATPVASVPPRRRSLSVIALPRFHAHMIASDWDWVSGLVIPTTGHYGVLRRGRTEDETSPAPSNRGARTVIVRERVARHFSRFPLFSFTFLRFTRT
jgi:hypothetical protein